MKKVRLAIGAAAPALGMMAVAPAAAHAATTSNPGAHAVTKTPGKRVSVDGRHGTPGAGA
jgi:hypothetical protein